MSAEKNIDRLFQEKFKDFEVAPNDAVWSRIHDSLPKKKKKRRVIALWWQVGGVAAALVLLFTIIIPNINSDTNKNSIPVIVDIEDNKNSKSDKFKEQSPEVKSDELKNDFNSKVENLEYADNDEIKSPVKENSNNKTSKQQVKTNKAKQLTVPNASQKNGIAINDIKQKKNNSNAQKEKSLIKNLVKERDTKVADNKDSNKDEVKNSVKEKSELKSELNKVIKNSDSAVADNSSSKNAQDSTMFDKTQKNLAVNETKETLLANELNKESIEKAIANQESITEKEKENDEQNRWSIAPNVAPVYFSSLGQGSSLDGQFNENSKSSDINMSYGIAGTYAVNNRFKLRAGINRVNLSQTTSNVFAYTGGEFASRGSSAEAVTDSGNIVSTGGNILLMSGNMFSTIDTPEIFNSMNAGNIDQRFGFIEVPLEVEYKVLDKKLGVNVIGGFSTFFLNQNEIYVDIDGVSTLIGEASNINSTSFSANFGLGLDYSLSKQWNINLEPQFKYQINTFNNTSGNFRPFFIGVYTGLSFKF